MMEYDGGCLVATRIMGGIMVGKMRVGLVTGSGAGAGALLPWCWCTSPTGPARPLASAWHQPGTIQQHTNHYLVRRHHHLQCHVIASKAPY